MALNPTMGEDTIWTSQNRATASTFTASQDSAEGFFRAEMLVTGSLNNSTCQRLWSSMVREWACSTEDRITRRLDNERREQKVPRQS